MRIELTFRLEKQTRNFHKYVPEDERTTSRYLDHVKPLYVRRNHYLGERIEMTLETAGIQRGWLSAC